MLHIVHFKKSSPHTSKTENVWLWRKWYLYQYPFKIWNMQFEVFNLKYVELNIFISKYIKIYLGCLQLNSVASKESVFSFLHHLLSVRSSKSNFSHCFCLHIPLTAPVMMKYVIKVISFAKKNYIYPFRMRPK